MWKLYLSVRVILVGIRRGDEGRVRDLIAKLGLWDVPDGIPGSRGPGCRVISISILRVADYVNKIIVP